MPRFGICEPCPSVQEKSIDDKVVEFSDIEGFLDRAEIRPSSPEETDKINVPYMESKVLDSRSQKMSIMTSGLNPCVAVFLRATSVQGNQAICLSHIAPQWANTEPGRHISEVVAPLIHKCINQFKETLTEPIQFEAFVHGRYEPQDESIQRTIHQANAKNIISFLNNNGITNITELYNSEADYRHIEYDVEQKVVKLFSDPEKGKKGRKFLMKKNW